MRRRRPLRRGASRDSDNKLYFSLGQPYNVQPAAKLEWYDRVGLGTIVRMERDGSNWEVYARGVRSTSSNFRTARSWFRMIW